MNRYLAVLLMAAVLSAVTIRPAEAQQPRPFEGEPQEPSEPPPPDDPGGDPYEQMPPEVKRLIDALNAIDYWTPITNHEWKSYAVTELWAIQTYGISNEYNDLDWYDTWIKLINAENGSIQAMQNSRAGCEEKMRHKERLNTAGKYFAGIALVWRGAVAWLPFPKPTTAPLITQVTWRLNLGASFMSLYSMQAFWLADSIQPCMA